MAVTPHEFIEIARKLMGIATFHSVQLSFDAIPVALDVLGMDAGYWIHKMMRVINNMMSSYRW